MGLRGGYWSPLDECYLSLIRYTMVFKVDASSEETIAADYKSIALAYNAGNSAEDAKIWLASNREQWLLLLDNADDINLDLQKHIPTGSNGNVLITTRDQGKRILSPEGACRVPQMEPAEAEKLLLRFTSSGSNVGVNTEAASLAKVGGIQLVASVLTRHVGAWLHPSCNHPGCSLHCGNNAVHC